MASHRIGAEELEQSVASLELNTQRRASHEVELVEEAVEEDDYGNEADTDETRGRRLRRVLARVVRLESVSKHPFCENLNVAQIGGWKVVVAPDEVEGTLGVYFEIDSILPGDAMWVQALRMPSKCLFHVRSTKIRGFLSQGLFASMHKLPLACSSPADEEKWLQHSDVTALLGVVKQPEHLDFKVPSIKVKALSNFDKTPFSQVFPHGPCKTEEFRVQSFMELLDAIMGKPYYMTVKIDGMSATYGYDETHGGLCACSRNYKVELDNSWVGAVGKMYGLEEKLKEHPNLVIQGEVYGPTVNKNLLQARTIKLGVFNVFDKEKSKRLPYEEMVAACCMLKIPMVPVEEVGDNFQYTLDELLDKAKGFYPNTKNHREGLVVRCQDQYDADKGYLSFKVLNNDYLLKHGR